MAAKKSQLSVLIPNRSFQVSIGDIEIKPFKFKQFHEALAIIEKYLKVILGGEEVTTGSIITFLLEKSEEDYAVLEDIVNLLKLVSGKEPEQIEDLSYDEVFGLLTEVIDQNMDFFSRIGKKIGAQQESQQESLNVAKAETTGELESQD